MSAHIVHKTDVLVIGAGVIGMSCAYELVKKGAKVAVIDQSDVGLGCSYGNAGWITPCFALPLPMPGMFFKAMKWLLDPLSPLHIKPEPSLLLLTWLIRFLHSMERKTAHRSVGALMEISKYSLTEYAQLEKEVGLSFGFEKKGLLMVGLSKEGIDSATLEMNLSAEFGIPGKYLDEGEVKSLEPALTGYLRGGVYFPEEAHCEPLLAVKAFAQGAQKHGVEHFPKTEVFDFQFSNGKIKAVRTTRGWFEADQVVLATGSWSNALGRQLKVRLPVMGGKGYSMILDSFDPSPKVPIMIVDKKIAVTPRQGSVKIAGTLELVNNDTSINVRRLNAILHGAQQCMNIPKDPKISEVWRGLRPCTPDGVPMIGYSKRYSNLFFSLGHQMLGLQSAPGSARLAKDLLTGEKPIFDPKPFDPKRFLV